MREDTSEFEFASEFFLSAEKKAELDGVLRAMLELASPGEIIQSPIFPGIVLQPLASSGINFAEEHYELAKAGKDEILRIREERYKAYYAHPVYRALAIIARGQYAKSLKKGKGLFAFREYHGGVEDIIPPGDFRISQVEHPANLFWVSSAGVIERDFGSALKTIIGAQRQAQKRGTIYLIRSVFPIYPPIHSRVRNNCESTYFSFIRHIEPDLVSEMSRADCELLLAFIDRIRAFNSTIPQTDENPTIHSFMHHAVGLYRKALDEKYRVDEHYREDGLYDSFKSQAIQAAIEDFAYRLLPKDAGVIPPNVNQLMEDKGDLRLPIAPKEWRPDMYLPSFKSKTGLGLGLGLVAPPVPFIAESNQLFKPDLESRKTQV